MRYGEKTEIRLFKSHIDDISAAKWALMRNVSVPTAAADTWSLGGLLSMCTTSRCVYVHACMCVCARALQSVCSASMRETGWGDAALAEHSEQTHLRDLCLQRVGCDGDGPSPPLLPCH